MLKTAYVTIDPSGVSSSTLDEDRKQISQTIREGVERLRPLEGILPDELVGAGGYGTVMRIKGFKIGDRVLLLPERVKVVVKEGTCKRPCVVLLRGVSTQRMLQLIQERFSSNVTVPYLYEAWIADPARCEADECLYGVAMEQFGHSLRFYLRKNPKQVLDNLSSILFQVLVMHLWLIRLNCFQPDLTINNIVMERNEDTLSVQMDGGVVRSVHCPVQVRLIDFDLADPLDRSVRGMPMYPSGVLVGGVFEPPAAPFIGLPSDPTVPLGLQYLEKQNTYYVHGMPDTGDKTYTRIAPFMKPLMLLSISIAAYFPPGLHPSARLLRNFQTDVMLIRSVPALTRYVAEWDAPAGPDGLPVRRFNLTDAFVNEAIQWIQSVPSSLLTDQLKAGSAPMEEAVSSPTPQISRVASRVADSDEAIKRRRLF